MDQTRVGTFPQPLSARQSGRLLARTLAKCRSILQQSAGEFFSRIAQRLPRRHGASRLAWGFDAASAALHEIEMTMSILPKKNCRAGAPPAFDEFGNRCGCPTIIFPPVATSSGRRR